MFSLTKLHVFSMVLTFTAVWSSSVFGSNTTTTPASCTPDYLWTENSRHVLPCLLVTNLLSAFSSTGDHWVAGPLSKNEHYPPPSGEETQAKQCACSWVAYNLLGACTVCQGISDSIQSWPEYSASCKAITDIYLPPQTLPDSQDLAIPFWAATDPDIWSAQRFNITEMREVAAQGMEDLLPSGHGRTSPGAPIVGIIFGLTFTALLAIGLYLIARIRQYDHIYLGN